MSGSVELNILLFNITFSFKCRTHCDYDRLRSLCVFLNINLGIISLAPICRLRKHKHILKTFYIICMHSFITKLKTTHWYEGCSLIFVIDSFSTKPASVPEENNLVAIDRFFTILNSPSRFKIIQLRKLLGSNR